MSWEVRKLFNIILIISEYSKEANELFQRMLQERKRQQVFPPSLKKFATTLHFYSPKAYKYVGNTFIKCLPHLITISKWYRNIDFSSGINKVSLQTIKCKVESMKKARSMNDILCNLVMDEMSIKKAVELVNDREYGYVDIGDAKDGKEAGNVLVVMVVCENGKFKIPVSHYFI